MKSYHEINETDQISPLLIADNASIHKTKRVSQLLNSNKVGLLTIYLYSPWLNPAEGFISSIKKKIRIKLETGRLLTEVMIKNWITEAIAGNPERFVLASQKETWKVIWKMNEGQ